MIACTKQGAAMVVTASLRRKEVFTVYVVGVVLVMMVAALVVAQARSAGRRRALELLRKRDLSGQALVRYVQLNRQCSEEAAYQRLATFVKKHVPLDDHGYVESMLVHERPSLLEQAQSIVMHDPDELDKI